MLSLRTRLAAVTTVTAALAVALPVAGAGAALPIPIGFTGSAANSNLCLSGVADPGPLGPSGPYGVNGPYGPNGPLHGAPNPLGDTANCGGGLAYMLNGGTVSSFVNANLASVGITSPTGG